MVSPWCDPCPDRPISTWATIADPAGIFTEWCSPSTFFQGSTDSDVFEDFIEQLLPHCGRWPEPESVLVMDNASFHRTERIEQMCADAGVKLVYLAPYSPDLNPIEEFFAELKKLIK